MKRKRIQYNELSEEIYSPVYWTKTRLILLGLFLLITGFLINFSLEEKINKFLQQKLTNNVACPVQFDKAELSYFLPKIVLKKPIIMGACFGQWNNRLPLKDIRIGFHSPSFYPLGLKLHVAMSSGKSNINLYPVISLFSQYLEIDKTVVDGQLFSPMMASNISPIYGLLNINGFFKLENQSIVDGTIEIASTNFGIPAQNISNFELPKLNLQTFIIKAHFVDPTNISIDSIKIGRANAPVEMNLKGNIAVVPGDFMNSRLTLNGNLKLSQFTLQTFSILNLFLPPNNTSGNYVMKLSGPLRNPGRPQFL